MDQIGSEWIRLDQIGSEWIRMDQIGSDWIRLDQIGSDDLRMRNFAVNSRYFSSLFNWKLGFWVLVFSFTYLVLVYPMDST